MRPSVVAARRRGAIPSERTFLDEESVVEYFRKMLKQHFGSLRHAFRDLDVDGAGSLTLNDLQLGLDHSGMQWPEVLVAGHWNLARIFKALDKQRSGSLSFSAFAGGDYHDDTSGDADWVYLTTMEQWGRYCHKTDAIAAASDRHPQWEPGNGTSELRCKYEERRSASHARMKKMIGQGTHKTPDGFKLTAWHLPAKLDKDEIVKGRRCTQDKITKSGRRIQNAITDTKSRRRDLHEIRCHLEAMEREEHSKQMKASMSQRKAGEGGLMGLLSGEGGLMGLLSLSDDKLTLGERVARDLAEELGLSLADIEAVQVQFDRFDVNGLGITSAAFPQLLAALLGVEKKYLPDDRVKYAWHALDANGHGRVSFSEYVLWHAKECGVSSLTSKTSQSAPKTAKESLSMLPDWLRQESFHSSSRTNIRSASSSFCNTKSSLLSGEARTPGHKHRQRSVTISKSAPVIVPVHTIVETDNGDS